MLTNIRRSLRSLLKTPGFTATALATLAICLGANLTIFAVIDAILLRPLPYADSDRLVTVYHTYPRANIPRSNASLTSYYERRGHIAAFSSLAAISEATSVVGETGATSFENLGRVSPEFFSTLGVPLLMGRAFTDAEMTYNTDHEAIVSYEYWHSRFNADPGILGKTIRRDGLSVVIVGVLPPDFHFLSFRAPLYVPLSSEESEHNLGARHNNGPVQIARLAPHATLADAQAQIDAFDAVHAAEFPEAKVVAEAGYRAFVAPLHADHVAPVRPVLLLLQAGALFLLVIGGVNLANLLLIRASGRSREFAIRRALGASQRHVVREVMTETILLAVTGALLGLVVGAIGIKIVATFVATQLPLDSEISFNFRIAVVALVGAVITGFALGLPIVWFNLRTRLAAALQSESRGSTVSRSTQRLRHGFIVAEIALAFVLLAGAGLLGLSLKRVMSVSPGFRTDHLITGQFTLPWSGYHIDGSYPHFFDTLGEKLHGLPGVVAAGAISNLPLNGTGEGTPMTIPGHAPKPGESVVVHPRFGVAGDYFAAMGIPLHAGRFLNHADDSHEAFNSVVDENFARRYWPDGDALGKQFYRGTTIEPGEKPYTIVGIVGAVKQAGLTEKNPSGSVYFSYNSLQDRDFFLVARTSLPPESLANTLTKIVREIDPELPLTNLHSMEVRIDDSLATRRSPALLAGIFAAAALLLATIGLYGVMAYSVAQRRVEFGIRMALGAQRLDVLRLVLGQGLRLIVVGLTSGIIAALLLTNLMSSLLFDVRTNDPLAFAGVAALLAGVAVLACWLPARRATKVDPMVALRSE
ncbi:MAG TPA: ABC transporter permease [Lacunisphaera sp.]|jgi:predicted permease